MIRLIKKWIDSLFEERDRCFFCGRATKLRIALIQMEHMASSQPAVEQVQVCEDEQDCWNHS